MKIEEINPKKKNKIQISEYWFPFSEGTDRLIAVLTILTAIIIALLQNDEENIIPAFFITFLIEIILYFAVIWIYQGYKKPTKNQIDEE